MQARKPKAAQRGRTTVTTASTRRVPAPPHSQGSAPTRKVFAILQTVARADRPLSLSEMTAMLGVPKPTMHRIARMLENDGLLEREVGGRRYSAGRRLLEFAFNIIASSVRRAPRHAVLESLSKQIGETCNLGLMVNNHVVYVDRVESKWPFGLRFEPGSRVPLHCTAIGKLFLSSLVRARQESIVGAMTLERYTDNTITDPQQLLTELDRIHRDGYATDDQEFLAGVVCLALPVSNSEGQMIGGLAISAPNARMNLQQALQYIPVVRQSVKALARTLSVERGHDIDDD